MMEAVKSVLAGDLSAKESAIRFQIPRVTLMRYRKKCEGNDINWNEVTIVDVPRWSQTTMFVKSSVLMRKICWLVTSSNGLLPMATRKLALANHETIQQTWTHKKTAVKDWLNVFMKMNNQLSLRSPNQLLLRGQWDSISQLFKKFSEI
ncbi:hypothetical protein HHI36_000095 [Cryptolaemus montrouzieri]|uniref:HTH psq-type domain-containing protein n=1 Tax=Cryptolaemus montrouzieri TaxID=559131 RepID=A0ABD2P3N4_9CUCU